MIVLLTLFILILGIFIAKTLMNVNLMVNVIKKKDKKLFQQKGKLF